MKDRQWAWVATYNAALPSFLKHMTGYGTSEMNYVHRQAKRAADRAWGDFETGEQLDDARDV
jgi:hypothetical protein